MTWPSGAGGAAGRRLVLEHYRWQSIGARYGDFLTRLLS